MHFSILVTSAMAVGALARPRPAAGPAVAEITADTEEKLSHRQNAEDSELAYFLSKYYNYITMIPGFPLPTSSTTPQSSPVAGLGVMALPTPPSRSTPVRPGATTSPNRVVAPPSRSTPVRPFVTPSPLRVSTPPARPFSPPPQSSSVRPVASVPSPLRQPSSSWPTIPPSSSSLPTPPPTTPLPNTHISGASQAALSAGPEYQAAILYHHNAARANHNAAPLVWDAACEANARLAAQTCTFAHYIPAGVRNGQNLFTTSGRYFNVTAGITEFWYKSEFAAMYPYFGATNVPTAVFHDVGHLTQMLWKGTTGVGCVSLDCGADMVVNGASSTLNKFTVCNYAPPGNINNQYGANVGVPISTTDLGSWLD